jgi:predicted nucleotidyltransferase
MRLTPDQQQAIGDTVREVFGPAATVRLFGSRIDDTRRGGDIDLLVQTDLRDPAAALDAKLDLLIRLKRRIGDRRIDIVLDYPGQPDPPPIVEIARATGIPL